MVSWKNGGLGMGGLAGEAWKLEEGLGFEYCVCLAQLSQPPFLEQALALGVL
jgi:hypothetical protein